MISFDFFTFRLIRLLHICLYSVLLRLIKRVYVLSQLTSLLFAFSYLFNFIFFLFVSVLSRLLSLLHLAPPTAILLHSVLAHSTLVCPHPYALHPILFLFPLLHVSPPAMLTPPHSIHIPPRDTNPFSFIVIPL